MIPQPNSAGNSPASSLDIHTHLNASACNRFSLLLSSIGRNVTHPSAGSAAKRILADADAAKPCPGSVHLILSHRRNPERGKTVISGCRRWRCTSCRPRRLAIWLVHVARHILRASEGGELPFVGRVADGPAWNAAKQALRRAQGDFARVVVQEGLPLVVATVAFLGSTSVEASEAVEAVALALLNTPIEFAPSQKSVSSSRAWSLHERRQSGYVLCGRITNERFAGVQRAIAAGKRMSSPEEGRA